MRAVERKQQRDADGPAKAISSQVMLM